MKNLTLTIIITLAAFGSIFSQEKTAMSGDQSLRSNARVNPSTLGMELNIPLASYPGRGPGVSVGLSYSSKLWRMERMDRIPRINGSTCYDFSTPRFAELSASGWTTDSAVPYIEYTGLDNVYDQDGKPAELEETICVYDGTPTLVQHVRRIMVHMPGGGSHELWASSDLTVSQGYSSYNPANVSWNGTYYSADGSNLIYQQDSTTSPATYRLLLPDGSRMDFGGSLETLTSGNTDRTVRKATNTVDTNGNKITYHAPASGYPNGYITDTMGRIISVPLGLEAPADDDPQEYTVPGLGENNITYTLQWKYLDDVLNNTSDQLCYLANKLPYQGSQDLPSGACKLFDSVYSSYAGANPTLGVFNPIVLGQIDLPNGSNYKFRYDKFGRIVKIEYPAGAIETFDYSLVPSLMPSTNNLDVSDQMNYGVSHREVFESSGATPIEWDYSAVRNSSPASYKVTTNAPDGTKTESFLTQGINPLYVNYGFDTPIAGRPYEQNSYDSNNNLISKTNTTYEVTGTTQKSHPRTIKVESIIYDPVASTALSTSVTSSYATIDSIDDPLLLTSSNQFGFTTSIGSLGALERTSETDYLSDSNYTARNLRSLPSETRIKDPNGNVKAKTHIFYDTDGGQSLLDESESTRWVDPNTTYRGLVTKTRTWYDISNNLYIDTQAQYDLMGNLRMSWDGRGNLSQIGYSSTYDYAYPSNRLSPVPDSMGTYGSDEELESTASYDYNTGLTLTVSDPNGAVTEMEYDDPFFRPTKVITASGNALEAETITEYGAGTSASTRWVKVKSQVDATNWKEGLSWFDGLGRTIRSESVDAESGDVFALTCYDAIGRPSKSSNPFREYNSTDHNCSTTNGTNDIYWTTNAYDDAGRPWKVTTPDGSEAETTYGLATTSGYLLGSVVTVEDQAGKLRRSITNALGQLKRVDEPSSSNVLGSISAPNHDTTYDYDYLNNLTTVTQGAQTRTFTYDALSRLKSAVNPESGTINYTYDANGNLATKIDARSITTSYSYDRLNRVTERSYAMPSPTPSPSQYQNSPTVNYYYDAVTNSKGKLNKVISSVSTTEYTSFDILGRVTGYKQTTDGVTYGNGSTDCPMTYSYNLGGALIEQQYPSCRVVKNELDTSGNLASVTSKENASAIFKTYVNSVTYNPAGAITSLKLGNGKYESTTFNSRLQPTQIALGHSETDTGILKLGYTYGSNDNNGNVLTQTITVPGLTYPLIQTYTYDSLNRLDDANETWNGTQIWRQDFSYDRYGNRNFVEANTSFAGFDKLCNSNTELCSTLRKQLNPGVNSNNNNRINSGQDYSYDSSGNTLTDANGQTFVYDSENKQVKASNSGGVVGEYFYDGDGKRVKKVVPATSETTIFVYDAAGKLIGEYSTIVENSTNAMVNYLTSDHLDSPRINTDATGSVIARHDYHPFGEEITATVIRSTTGYSVDTVRKQFTGYERDNETNLDFAQARNYKPSIGRFTSVDPMMASADILNPQTLNRYVYVGNNPVNITDPSGLIWGVLNGKVDWYKDKAALTAAGASVYESLVGIVDGKLVALDPNKFGYTFIASNTAALRDLASMGATAAQLTASAAILTGSLAAASPLLAAAGITLAAGGVVYLYTQYPAAMGKMKAAGCPATIECPSVDDVNMMRESLVMTNSGNSGNTELSAPNLGGETTPADPNSRKPKDVDNEPRKGSVPLKLTKEQIATSRIIAKGSSIRDVRRLVRDYGGRAKDWTKKSTQVTEINGRRAEVHWYQNKAVGKVELKVKYLD